VLHVRGNRGGLRHDVWLHRPHVVGPVLYFAVGTYVFDIALTHWGVAARPSLLLTFGVSLVLAVVLGAIALRVHGIAFAMVTLAFAQRSISWWRAIRTT